MNKVNVILAVLLVFILIIIMMFTHASFNFAEKITGKTMNSKYLFMLFPTVVLGLSAYHLYNCICDDKDVLNFD